MEFTVTVRHANVIMVRVVRGKEKKRITSMIYVVLEHVRNQPPGTE